MADRKALNAACPGCGSTPVVIGDITKCPGCGRSGSYEAEYEFAVKHGKYTEHLITFLPRYYKLSNIQEEEAGYALTFDISREEADRIERALKLQGLTFSRAQFGDQVVFTFRTASDLEKASEIVKASGFTLESVFQEIKTFAAAEHPGTEFHGNIIRAKGDTETPGVGANDPLVSHEGKPFKVPGAEKTFEYVAQWKGPKSTTTQWKVSESRQKLYEQSSQLKKSNLKFDIVAHDYLPIHAERLRPYCQYVFLFDSFTVFDGIQGGKNVLTVMKYIPDSVKIEFFEHTDKLLCHLCGYPVLGDSQNYICICCRSLFQKIQESYKRFPLEALYIIREAELEQKPVSLYMAVVTGDEKELEDLAKKGTDAGLYAEVQGGKLFLKGSKKALKAFLTDIGLEEEKPEEPEIPPEKTPPEETPPEEVPAETPPAEPGETPPDSKRITKFSSKDGRLTAELFEESSEEEKEETQDIDKDAGGIDPEKLVKEPLKQAIKAAGIKRDSVKTESQSELLSCKCGFRTISEMLKSFGITNNSCPKCGRIMEKELYIKPKPYPWGQDIDKDKGAIDLEPDQGGVWAQKELDFKNKELEDEETEEGAEEEVEETKEAEEEELEERKKVKLSAKDKEKEKEQKKKKYLEALALNPDRITDLDVEEVNKLAKAMGFRPLTPGQVKRILLYATQHEDIKQIDKLVDVESPLSSLVLGYFLGRFNR